MDAPKTNIYKVAVRIFLIWFIGQSMLIIIEFYGPEPMYFHQILLLIYWVAAVFFASMSYYRFNEKYAWRIPIVALIAWLVGGAFGEMDMRLLANIDEKSITRLTFPLSTVFFVSFVFFLLYRKTPLSEGDTKTELGR